jgi:SAM-dependent methyltransferase
MAANEAQQGTSECDESPGGVFQQGGMGVLWSSGAAMRARSLGPATELMLDLAQMQAGDRVLDVAAGTGETSILAARRVGPTGQVLATDISASMLEVAAQDAQKAGLSNIETRTLDAQSMDLPSESFDAVISRMGIMLMPDRHLALAEMRRVLKPGRRLAVIVWATAERNLSSLLPQLIARRHAKLPPPAPDAPGMFALGAPGLLERTLSEAGFQNVVVRATPAPRHFSSSEEMTRYITTATPMLHESLSKLDDDGRAAMLAEIEETMRQFEGPDGLTFAGEVLVGVGTR